VTAAQLLSYTTVALLLQVVAGVAFAVWRRPSIAGAPLQAGEEEAVAAAGVPSGAWSGWRDLRVVRREFEDAAHTRCSFYLEPVDGAPFKPFQAGQYLTFSVKVPDGVAGAPGGASTITRCYSLSDRPDPMGYRVIIKRVPPPSGLPELPPGVSSRRFHDRGHELTPANMQAKHQEEGVAEGLDNCVRCHRSASGEGEGKGKGERGKGKREKD
jgi:hypothetical protein